MTPMRLRLHRGSILFLGSYLELSGRIGTRRFYTHDPKSYGELWVSSLARGLAYGPGVPWEPEIFVFVGTVLRLPRQDYYRYLFGFRILPLGSWPLSSSYDVFYLCKKSLIGLEGASVDQKRAEAAWERTHFSHPIDRVIPPSIDINPSTSIDISHTTSIDIRPKPKITISEKDKFDNQYLTPDEFGIFRDPDGYAIAIDGRTLHVSREDIVDILQTANGADNLFMQQHTFPEHQQKVTKEFYDTAGGIDKRFKQWSRHPTRPSIDVDVPTSVNRRPEFGRRAFDLFGTRKFYWEEKDQYGVYRDDQGCARDVDGHIINVSKEDIRKLMERASKDEHSYICLLEHASSFTQSKLVPEIYTKNEINEMFYGICGEQEKNKEDFQMKHSQNSVCDGRFSPYIDG
ncbi:hypothetical protein DY000_02007862 [Brassica cretica]|uniref:Uncharacterized protein n=1 Tax=Brassica cretica TaxID=69181 RepID=A0ABQ7BZG5_BRACR|nr:hypothetical protein DY000_02007862 [Brassica cretica]